MFWHGSPSFGAGSRITLSAGATLVSNGALPPGRKHCSAPVNWSTLPVTAGSAVAAGQSGLNESSIPARPAVPGWSANAVSAARTATSRRLDAADMPYLHARQAAVRAADEPDRAQLGVLLHLPEHEDRVGLAVRDPHLVVRHPVRGHEPPVRRAGLVVHPRERARLEAVAPG